MSACSALSRQRTPLPSSSRSTSFTWRSAVVSAGPIGSMLADRLLTTSVKVTATTNSVTTANMTRARLRIWDTVQFQYHPITALRMQKEKRLDDFGAEDVV